MKTELTLQIEKKLEVYDPTEVCGVKINMFRPRIKRFEVAVEYLNSAKEKRTGIVDCLCSSEAIQNITTTYRCALNDKDYTNQLVRSPALDTKKCDVCGTQSVNCVFQYRQSTGENTILFTAYEIKISKQDFLSSHGHNFCGHFNFYVMPYILFKEIKNIIEPDVGVIALTGNGVLRKVKNSAYSAISEEGQKWLLLSMLKNFFRKRQCK